jgi:LuxR family quorum-sensing system transcriptional regulator SolR
VRSILDAWREASFDVLLNAESEDEVFKLVMQMTKSLGFEFCAYGARMPLPISQPKTVLFNNYSSSWQKRYQERGYLEIDPTVQHALKSAIPLVWSDEVFKPSRELWEDARSHGLKVGWAQSSRDSSGCVGLLTFARGDEQLSSAELGVNQEKMVWIAQFVHAAMVRHLTAKMLPETQAQLTAREIEVLRWTAEGKTSNEIAQILSISERTANFHINNVLVKLGALNKTQAAVKAAVLGILF